MVGKSKKNTNDTTLKNETTIKESETTVVENVRKMKALVLNSTNSGSDYSTLQVKDEDFPKCDKDDMILVKIKAVGLNFAELMQRQGIYKPSTKTPYTPGCEGSGIVEEVSSNVTDFNKDDRVIVLATNGIWKEYVLVPKSQVFKIPEEMTFEEAAGLIVNYLTAYQMLFRLANIREGDKVLIHMDDGGVGLAATQLCANIPNVTVFVVGQAPLPSVFKDCDSSFNYITSDYVEQVRKMSPEGVDVVLDPLNGDNSIKGFDLLKPLGRIIHYGASNMTGESRSLANTFKTWWKCLSINALEIMSENKSMSGYHLGYLLQNPTFLSTVTTDIATLMKMYTEKKIKINVDSTYSYSKVGEAMKRMHQRLNIGKIILKPDCEMPEPEPEQEPEVVAAASIEQVKLTEKLPVSEETETENKTEKEETSKTEEQKIIEKTPVSEITKPVLPTECATRE